MKRVCVCVGEDIETADHGSIENHHSFNLITVWNIHSEIKAHMQIIVIIFHWV